MCELVSAKAFFLAALIVAVANSVHMCLFMRTVNRLLGEDGPGAFRLFSNCQLSRASSRLPPKIVGNSRAMEVHLECC